jgi:ferric-dicitrate binding protein FerR (iron transport regulator)
MTPEQAHQVLVDAVNAANVKGTYNLQDISTILEALRTLKPQEQLPVKEEKK